MVKYVEFDKVNMEHTVLEFRGGSENVVVTGFTGENVVVNVVSIASDDESKIDELIASQPSEINCREILQDEFRTLVKDSEQIKNINRQIKNTIAKKYDFADEIAMGKRATDDSKRIEYDTFVADALAKGDEIKASIGY
ncbi:hypothetical protein [Halarcobacter anaerophilus]|uniref:Uncharacterized protein n=1 Tax=Halarcobacter anaerophilus TaxID=877500 RepID=A0A4Q0Y0R9_9BACT|nr:hypothetical protein [Halarcobacter anaerophilus]QDF29001.1 hypothetical protein AANAER_1521 [Halarcobacter anaerophilus]RXJ63636.1 hypothetical protein CRV06_05430 [Halarcobacter anaerophilus]